MSWLSDTLGYHWGRTVVRYFDWAVSRGWHVEGREHFPDAPVICICWHGVNLLGLVAYGTLGRPRRCLVPVTYGLAGAVSRGWGEGTGLKVVQLPRKGKAHAALAAMEQGLKRGDDVVLATDGPRGPVGRVRPGAVWLARATGCPIILGGLTARPAAHLPRWDRLTVPLPGARGVLVVAEPVYVEPHAEVDGALLDDVSERLHAVTARAWELAKAGQV
ncbi:MAG TPA: hypothetical protein VER55_15495 [Ardenticatenaceae bacterium]|nr:hypothetical protein [Ardenticatenaceae bacterium]